MIEDENNSVDASTRWMLREVYHDHDIRKNQDGNRVPFALPTYGAALLPALTDVVASSFPNSYDRSGATTSKEPLSAAGRPSLSIWTDDDVNANSDGVAIPICRFCFEEDRSKQLISPCDCSGNSKWVHTRCLRRWQRSRKNEIASFVCRTCNVEYGLPTLGELVGSYIS